jgi:hypothetical protein
MPGKIEERDGNGLAWMRGDPMWLVSDEREAEVVLNRIANRRAECADAGWTHRSSLADYSVSIRLPP